MKKAKAILFDWDNTLVNTWPIIHAALHETFVKLKQTPWTMEQVQQRVRKSMRDSFPEVFGADWQLAAEFYQTAYRSRNLTELEPLQGAEDTLKMLRADKDLFIAVVSNKRGFNLRQEAEALGWMQYFDALVGADDASHDKPHKAPVELALKDSGMVAGADVWFVGDSEIDLECAQNTGCTGIFYGEADGADGKQFGGFPYAAHGKNHEELQKILVR